MGRCAPARADAFAAAAQRHQPARSVLRLRVGLDDVGACARTPRPVAHRINGPAKRTWQPLWGVRAAPNDRPVRSQRAQPARSLLTGLQHECDRVLREQVKVGKRAVRVRHVQVGHLLIEPTSKGLRARTTGAGASV
eukprot:5033114-Prymnesium_polylepis.2